MFIAWSPFIKHTSFPGIPSALVPVCRSLSAETHGKQRPRPQCGDRAGRVRMVADKCRGRYQKKQGENGGSGQ